MAKSFDATLNTLIDDQAADWVKFLAARAGTPPGPATVLDTDLSVTAQPDKLFRVEGEPPYILHLELESTGRTGIPTELLRYNVPVHGLHKVPVHSVLVLLRPKATAKELNGVLRVPGVDGRPYLTFRYTVVRVWRESVAGLLAAGLGLAPLAVVTDEAARDLEGAFGRLDERLRRPRVSAKVRKQLLGATYFLAGLRYREARIADLYERLSMTLEDSTTYQGVLKRGLAQGVAQGTSQTARATILTLGAKRFGPPPAAAATALDAMTDPDRLRRIADRLLDAAGWDDLVATP